MACVRVSRQVHCTVVEATRCVCNPLMAPTGQSLWMHANVGRLKQGVRQLNETCGRLDSGFSMLQCECWLQESVSTGTLNACASASTKVSSSCHGTDEIGGQRVGGRVRGGSDWCCTSRLRAPLSGTASRRIAGSASFAFALVQH